MLPAPTPRAAALDRTINRLGAHAAPGLTAIVVSRTSAPEAPAELVAVAVGYLSRLEIVLGRLARVCPDLEAEIGRWEALAELEPDQAEHYREIAAALRDYVSRRKEWAAATARVQAEARELAAIVGESEVVR